MTRLCWLTLATALGGGLLAACSAPGTVPETPALPLTSQVDLFIGTDRAATIREPEKAAGWANAIPGVSLPFGMVQWGPDTATAFHESATSYRYTDSAIRAFSTTHLSGVGCPVYADFPFIPVVGALRGSPAGWPETYHLSFSRENEEAAPGLYRVGFDNGLEVALTATTRTALATLTFPEGEEGHLFLNAARSATRVRSAEVKLDGRRFQATLTAGAFCGTLNRYTVHLAGELERAPVGWGTFDGEEMRPDTTEVSGENAGAWLSFDTTEDRVVRFKFALSYTSPEGAARNLEAESPGWDFEATRAAADSAWEEALGTIRIGGGTESQRRVFYSALYRSLLHPNVASDADGSYRGFDDEVHEAPGSTHYANFSGWDVYRSQMALLALVAPDVAGDFGQSLLRAAEQGGGLPVWTVANDESGVMIGDPAAPTLATLHAFGMDGFDASQALEAMVKAATDPRAMSRNYPQRRRIAEYVEHGYVPLRPTDEDRHIGIPGPDPNAWGPASMTLEYGVADFAIAQMARDLGDDETHMTFLRRSAGWRHLLDPETGYIRPRGTDGEFIADFEPASGRGFCEGNAVQYTWMVPHDLGGVVEAVGGREEAIGRLDALFAEYNAGSKEPYFYIGNEPVHGVPWAYNWAGAPWKTQWVVRDIGTQLFHDGPGGLPGNDDLGATSAWYVFTALGIYPAIPGVGGFALHAPLFPEAVLRRGADDIRIVAKGAAADAPYVQSLEVNGHPHDRAWVDWSELEDGGTLTFGVGTEPNEGWGVAAPPSFGPNLQ